MFRLLHFVFEVPNIPRSSWEWTDAGKYWVSNGGRDFGSWDICDVWIQTSFAFVLGTNYWIYQKLKVLVSWGRCGSPGLVIILSNTSGLCLSILCCQESCYRLIWQHFVIVLASLMWLLYPHTLITHLTCFSKISQVKGFAVLAVHVAVNKEGTFSYIACWNCLTKHR